MPQLPPQIWPPPSLDADETFCIGHSESYRVKRPVMICLGCPYKYGHRPSPTEMKRIVSAILNLIFVKGMVSSE